MRGETVHKAINMSPTNSWYLALQWKKKTKKWQHTNHKAKRQLGTPCQIIRKQWSSLLSSCKSPFSKRYRIQFHKIGKRSKEINKKWKMCQAHWTGVFVCGVLLDCWDLGLVGAVALAIKKSHRKQKSRPLGSAVSIFYAEKLYCMGGTGSMAMKQESPDSTPHLMRLFRPCGQKLEQSSVVLTPSESLPLRHIQSSSIAIPCLPIVPGYIFTSIIMGW